jgi:hypothetical protein
VLALALAAFFSSCATEKPRTALINDPDAQQESSIPWNRPQKWESGAAFPGGGAGGFGSRALNDPTTPY